MKKQTSRYRFALITVIFLLLASLLVSCAKAYDNAAGSPSLGYDKSTSDYESSSNGSGIGNVPNGTPDDPDAKIIKTANASLTTLEYDTFIESLYRKITELSGYTDSDSFGGSAPSRYANVTARVPSVKLDDFKSFLSGNATLTYYSAKKEDVTVRYATLSAELDALSEKKAAISALLAQATSLSEIQSLTTAVYDTDREINKIRAELESYDGKIAYSTVYISIREIEEYIAPTVEEKGVFKRIGEGFTKNLSGAWTFIVDLFVWLISAIPYLVLVGAAVTGLVFILIKVRRIEMARYNPSEKKAKSKRFLGKKRSSEESSKENADTESISKEDTESAEAKNDEDNAE